MSNRFTNQQLQGYLDEILASELMVQIEQALRSDAALRDRLVQVAATREAGVHGLGEIWRRQRLTCPSRQQLGSFLLSAMDDAQLDYIRFHLQTVQCRYCLANLDDLKQQNSANQSAVQSRRRKYFQTSAGYLSSRLPPSS
ncbi:MAG: hypothetical protein KF752_06730 [Pirellulaceae bacterium]|nr:hypothetical protein [Pirellulaceae bacterium]